MAEKIMFLYVLEIYSFAYSLLLVDFTGVGMQLRIVTYPPQVGLEVGIVDRVEADEGDEKALVRFGDLLTAELTPSLQSGFELVEAFEECLKLDSYASPGWSRICSGRHRC